MPGGVGDRRLLGALVRVAARFFFFFFKFSFSSRFLLRFPRSFFALFSLSEKKTAPGPHVLLVDVDDKVAVVLEHGLALAVGRDELLALVEDGAGAEEGERSHFLLFGEELKAGGEGVEVKEVAGFRFVLF